ncbi:acetylglutamate kinase ArgB [Gottschalkia purinilytica]|uniref:Acetylglutamate kinase n=1 Tax=Gottschalkia purinilytica TaxID=1503 RepID=A0A0L0WD34_GOTPU|nr:acetylglutamate kinase [Gottschalkia purinilytica]KNF09382.1 acetylglutamate kinase ArgB [Gottschalkia purinilytica]
MEKHINKAKTLIEAIPYIQSFRGKTVVIKYGGSAMIDEEIKAMMMQDIALLKLIGIEIVLVHGGGPFINETLHRMNKESKFIDGLRVTDKETMEIAEMVLSGKINKEIVNDIEKNGLKAVGISGKDGMTLKAKKKIVNGIDIGYVGDIVDVDTNLITCLLQCGYIPVIAPIGRDEEGNTYNINADYAAVAIAGALNAQKLVYVTDVKGVMEDINDPKSLITLMTVNEAKKNIESGTIYGGMIPKVECCVSAVEKGVDTVHIIDGRVEHSILLEIFTQEGIGTMFK